jgi:hypothetical protein
MGVVTTISTGHCHWSHNMMCRRVRVVRLSVLSPRVIYGGKEISCTACFSAADDGLHFFHGRQPPAAVATPPFSHSPLPLYHYNIKNVVRSRHHSLQPRWAFVPSRICHGGSAAREYRRRRTGERLRRPCCGTEGIGKVSFVLVLIH